MSTGTVSTSREATPAIALALQGGGGLGAYHIGAYEALAEEGLLPDWVCGISIGAFNAAVIAGNPPEQRVAKLEGFWDAISWPDVCLPAHALQLRYWHNAASYAGALLFGQPNFFIPRGPVSLLAADMPPQEASFYDTTPLLSTLRRFADFPIDGHSDVRLSLGATEIETGNIHYFDSTRHPIEPAHVLASGSLPPGFPATEVDGKLYWDGACVSNTPLDEIVDESDHAHLVVFMIDLWNAAGKPPRNMNEVFWRMKQIEYASRTGYHLKSVANKVKLRQAMQLLNARNAAGAAQAVAVPDDPVVRTPRLDIVHIIYHPGPDQVPESDAEFSRESIAERRRAGYADLKGAIAKAPWLSEEVPAHLGVLVHHVENGRVTTEAL
jgi:NTE family protein